MSVTGVVLVSRPPFLFGSDAGEAALALESGDRDPALAPRQLVVMLCVIGAFLNGTIFIIVRKIGKKAHWMALVFSFSVWGIVISGTMLLAGVQEASWPSPFDVGFSPYAVLLAVGLLASLAQSLFNFGMQLESATVASITRQLDVPFSFLWQVVAFGQTPTGPSILGAIFVLTGTSSVMSRRLLCAPKEVATIEKLKASEHAVCEGGDVNEESKLQIDVEILESTSSTQDQLQDQSG